MRALRADRERGSAAVEAVIGIPAFGLFVALIIIGGRVAVAHQGVEVAAADAARAASISRTQSRALDAATRAATTSLGGQGLACQSTAVSVDVTGFAAPVGTPASVRATVTCVVSLSDLAIPGSGSRTIRAAVSSPLDTYRER